MKNYIILFIFSLSVMIAYSQVAINTVDPKGIFYIDGKSDNTTAAADRYKNDVMVDTVGSIILGQPILPVTSIAKVDITTDVAYGALKIADGGEGEGMVLLGDANGYARWGQLKGAGGFKLGIGTPIGAVDGDMSPGTNYVIPFNNNLDYILIREPGNYIVMIRATFFFKGAATRATGVLSLYKNTITAASNLDSFEPYFFSFNNTRFSVYTILRAYNMLVGDKLYWTVRPATTDTIWMINEPLTTVFFYRV